MGSGETLILTMSADAGWHHLIGSLMASVPLAGLSVILYRTGRRGAWLLAPWAVAAVLGVGSLVGFAAIPDIAAGAPRMLLAILASGWSSGAYAATFVTILWLAIFGVYRRRSLSEGEPRSLS